MTTESLKVRVGDQWEDDYKNRYIITCFSTSYDCYFFLISKETGRIAGKLDTNKHRFLYGAPEPIYNQGAREALNITQDMVFIGNAADRHIGEARWDKQKGPRTYEHLAIQPWYFIEANQLSFLEGSVIKRLCRHKIKDGVKDIDKAIDELQKIKEYEYGDSYKQNQGKNE